MTQVRLPLLSLALVSTGLTVAVQASLALQAPVPLQLVLLQYGVAALLLIAPLRPGLQLPALLVGAAAQALAVASWLLEGTGGYLLPWAACVQAVILAVAAGIVIHDARREARWNGMVPLRPEAW